MCRASALNTHPFLLTLQAARPEAAPRLIEVEPHFLQGSPALGGGPTVSACGATVDGVLLELLEGHLSQDSQQKSVSTLQKSVFWTALHSVYSLEHCTA